MQSPVRSFLAFFISPQNSRSRNTFSRVRLHSALALFAAAAFASPAMYAQSANRITQSVDASRAQTLPNHHPLWASSENSTGIVPASLSLNELTLVLSRSPQQEQAFQQFLADQQNPVSTDFHHWLTPVEVGERFGLSDQDIATITGWLQSQGLRIDWIAPSRIFIGFGGTAADVGHAFQTEMHYYNVGGTQRISVNTDPLIPAALVPAIKAIRGLYSIDEHPTHHISAAESASPQLTTSTGTHYIAPNDFNIIYDVPSGFTGAGTTIGIVSWSHTNPVDFDNFKSKTGATFTDPTEVVPTAFGGIDPGPALTAPPAGGSSTLAGQEEATLDVIRAGSVAPAANLLLLVSSPSGSGNGIGADAQYLVNTTPVPAQVMSISFGACELNAGSSGVAFWNTLFQQAASEGISVFVSSGDSGASGCDVAFSAPPASPKAISPNYICSSSFATCVGGTQFADTASPSTYWSSTNSTGFLSALGYIPEGGWNESTTTSVAATGGGVSSVIATPSWQTQPGNAVLSAKAGRYTPDVSFSSSTHDGYFACLAAISGGGCVTSGGTFGFVIFSGTSAAAPGMAGVAALLDQKQGAPQGNLNPQIYGVAAFAPTAFHDATVASSAVSGCTVSVPSICNNSIPLASGSGAQAGYQLGTGYDEVAGLGSLDVVAFFNNYITSSLPPTAVTGAASNITASSATLIGAVNPNGADTHVWFLYGTSNTLIGATQTAIQDLGSGNTNTAPSVNISGLSVGTTYYFQVVAQNGVGTSSGTINSFATTSVVKATPTITWSTPAAISYGTALSATQLNAIASVPGSFSYSPALGTVLTAGSQVLTANFTPTDTTNYNTASANVTLTVNKVTPTVTWSTPAPIPYGTALSATQLNATASVPGSFSYSPALGTVLTAGSQVLTAIFTPTDSTDYNTASGSVTLTVNRATPIVTWSAPAAITYGTALSATQLNATASAPGSFSYSPALGAVLTAGSHGLTANFTPTDTTDYNNASGNVTLTVNKATPTITWNTPAAVVVGTPLSTTQLNATASVPGTFVYNPAAGTVMSTVGSPTLSTTFTPTDTTDYNNASSSVTLTVTAEPPAGFAVSGTAVTISTPGATTGNVSTIAVTPSNGFTGSVTLTAQITTSPAGAQFPPTLSFGATTPVTIASASAGSATLTVSTTASASASLAYPMHGGSPWYARGGAALACILFFCFTPRRRSWRNLLGMIALLIALGGGAIACGGSSISSNGSTGTTGTTLGSYTITLTGTSGSTSATNTIALTVQ
jgi:subtilase family serine protease